MSNIADRRAYTEEKIAELQKKLKVRDAEKHLSDIACIYATGSFGRLEASQFSDLDVFIVSLHGGEKEKKSEFTRLNEILVKADLISTTREMEFPEFDGDGKYLSCYSSKEFVDKLGTANDDYSNTLTGRLLLFLESRPLLGDKVYYKVIDDVISEYWEDFPDHADDFVPAFLANDILRLWRTFCVNYEASTKPADDEGKKNKRKMKNYKLKHSRMLTCYSALIFLLGTYRQKGTVSIQSAKEMTKLTPIQRLDAVTKMDGVNCIKEILRTKEIYEKFLEYTKDGDEKLKELLSDPKRGNEIRRNSSEFGEAIFSSLQAVALEGDGKYSKLYRLMVV